MKPLVQRRRRGRTQQRQGGDSIPSSRRFTKAILAPFCVIPRSRAFCRTSTFRSTARWWKPGPRSRVSAPRTVQTSHPRQGNGERHFHNEKRSNETHASTTDPDARLYRKGSSQAAKLSYMGHALMENRHGLVVGATLTPATGTAEREAAIKMIVRRSPGARRLTLAPTKVTTQRTSSPICGN